MWRGEGGRRGEKTTRRTVIACLLALIVPGCVYNPAPAGWLPTPAEAPDDAHGAWMIRAYALGMGAGTQVLTHLPWFLLAGYPGEWTRAILMGAGWVINVAVAEWIIRKGIRKEASRPSAVPASVVPARLPGGLSRAGRT